MYVIARQISLRSFGLVVKLSLGGKPHRAGVSSSSLAGGGFFAMHHEPCSVQTWLDTS
jgi:hypothetical protein